MALFPALNGNRFREKRFQHFLDLIERSGRAGKTRILDLGGTEAYWQALRPAWERYDLDITIVNLDVSASDHDVYHLRAGNACRLEDADNAFDIVHSNSVIEHVGGWASMTAMAGEVRRLAPRYFVQVPNFWFPMEPHFRVPFFHWLPEVTRARMVMRKDHGLLPRQGSMADAMALIQSAQLLTAAQMQALFPDAAIEREKVMLLTKSVTAVRRG